MPLRLLSVLALGAAATAQSLLTQPRSAEDLLPASTYAAMRFGGLEACRAATAQLPISSLFRAVLGSIPEELKAERLDRNLDQAAQQFRDQVEAMGLQPADLRALVGQPIVMAVGRLSLEGMGPSFVLMIEQGQHGEAIARCLDTVMQQAPNLREVGVVDVGGVSLRQVAIEDGPPVFLGPIGGSFCIGNSRGYLAEMAAVAAGRQPSLTASSRLGAVRQALPAPALASFAINLGSVMASLAPHLPYEAGALSDALGIGQVDLVYGAMTADQSGGTDLLHVGVGGNEHGLIKALVAEPVDLAFATACSENTVVFGAGSFDVPAVVDAFSRFVELLPAEPRDELKKDLGRELKRAFRQAGMSAEQMDQLVRAFGGQMGFAIALEKGAVPKPELLVRIAVKDAAPVAALLQRFEAASAQEAGLEWRSREVDDCVVRFVNLPLPELELQLSPCYALHGDSLWIASDAPGLVRALRRGQEPGEGLLQEPDFAAMARSSAGASGVLHLRSFRGVELGWRAVETMVYPLIDAQRDQIGFDSASLPDSEQLAAALGTTTYLYGVDDDGVTVKGQGTFAFGALLAAFGALGDHVMERATGKIY